MPQRQDTTEVSGPTSPWGVGFMFLFRQMRGMLVLGVLLVAPVGAIAYLVWAPSPEDSGTDAGVIVSNLETIAAEARLAKERGCPLPSDLVGRRVQSMGWPPGKARYHVKFVATTKFGWMLWVTPRQEVAMNSPAVFARSGKSFGVVPRYLVSSHRTEVLDLTRQPLTPSR